MYTSTRKKINISASKAIIDGLSNDGGLFITDKINKVVFDEKWLNYTYQEITKLVFMEFLDDFTENDINEIINKAYNKQNFPDKFVGFDDFKNFAFLTLYHGPTFAFKDMALTVLPYLMEKSQKIQNIKKKTIILTATSGDTGSAALSGFSKTSMKTIVLYPNKGVSEFQEKQMHYFNNEENVIAIEGNFDDCQRIVKSVLEKKKNKNIIISSANSINIGRLIPQIVYYFYGYLMAVKKNKIIFKDKIDICVPTGNFGDILAGYIAKKMGLPIDKLLCASNQNNVLTDFFKTGIYNSNRQLKKTISPSMDILISSNLERLLYISSGNDYEYIHKLMNDLRETGTYEVNDKIRESLDDFIGEFINEEETEKMIKEVYEEYNYLIDPHTAVSYGVYKKENRSNFTLILSTANPYKFVDTVSKALDQKTINCFNDIESINKYTSFPLDKRIRELQKIEINKTIWEKEDAIIKLRKLIGEIDD